MTSNASHDIDLAMATLAELLDRANQASTDLVEAEPAFPTHSLALGILLVQSRVAALRPEAAALPRPEVDDGTDEPGVGELLREAEAVTRRLPLEAPTLNGLSEITVALCDLVREAEALA